VYAKFGETIAAKLRTRRDAKGKLVWPSPKYAHDPVGFCRDILGFDVWDKQRELLEAVRDNDLVAVRAAQKVSKSHSAAALALWWYCTVPGAKVRMTSATAKQVEDVLYTQLLELKANSGVCLDCLRESYHGAASCEHLDHGVCGQCLRAEYTGPKPCAHSALIDGVIGKTSRSGFKNRDFRVIKGFTSKTAEGLAGYSGANQLWILDESSGIPNAIYEAVLGNLIAGGKLLVISNPTKTHGFFYDLFNKHGIGFKLLHISGMDSPNVREGQRTVPGLASLKSIERLAAEYGRDSPIFRVRALGEFADIGEGRIFSPEALKVAYEADTAAVGTLSIGIDPSGPSGTGDESGWCAVRGRRELRLEGHLGLSDVGHVAMLEEWLRELAGPGELAVVTVDREGSVGAAVYAALKAWADAHPGRCVLRGLRSSEKAIRQPLRYDLIRDELCGAVEAWIADGGSLRKDSKREADLRALEWIEGNKGLTKLIPKKRIKQILGRSPDRYDALSLAVWNSGTTRTHSNARTAAAAPPKAPRRPNPYAKRPDPYAHMRRR